MKHVWVVCLLIVVGCGDQHRGNRPSEEGPDAAVIPDPQNPVDNVTEVVCAALPPTTNGATCEVSGTGATKLLKGIVLTPSTVYRGGQVAVNASGAITCVGCDCAAGGETVISCPDGAISPGLINAHDHITFTQNDPYTNTGERYEHRHQWRKGQDMHPRIPSPGSATGDQIRWGELRFLMGGATSIVGSGGQAGLLRNLDSASQQEGLGQGVVNFDTFPLDDSGGNRRTSDCNYGAGATTAASIANDAAYEPHTAEGIDASARNEFLCESSDTYDATAPGVSHNLLLGKTAMIHAIGLKPTELGAMAQAGTGLIWSPRSNITLYGDTARVAVASRLGVEIALGTDWMPTGSMNLLRELKCADSYNEKYLHYFTDSKLWQMVTTNAAAVTATDDVIGLLAPGKVADIAVFRANGGKTFRAVIDAEPADVALVMRGGKTLYGDDPAVAGLAQACDVVDVCGTSKRVCLMGEVGKGFEALKASAGSYPAFVCGQPANEPSCTPSRPKSVNNSSIYTGVPSDTDMDGDGIANATDKCPTTFDPMWPLDNGVQADGDGDGLGDACDPCPLDAGTTTCSAVDPNDRDHDGSPNDVDNCADVPNPGQEDADHDGHGDVCDTCPATPNPGATGCAVSIYSIKNGTTAPGSIVRVNNALVTGKGSNGFFVQVKAGDVGFDGVDYSGLFVFTSSNAALLEKATVGGRVAVEGRVTVFQGQTELDTVSLVEPVAGAPLEPAPEPVAVTYAEVKTGGARAAQLEAVIVALGAATVSATNAEAVEFTLAAGDESLVVDDFLFAVTPLPAVGTSFAAVRGVLTLRQSTSKLEVRDAGDLTVGAPGLASFGPALSYARVGVTTDGETFPAGSELTVTLTGPAQGDTTVTLATSDDAVLGVSDVVVPNGATTARAKVTARSASATPVTVTATLASRALPAAVRVLGETEGATVVALSPPTAAIPPTGTVAFAVALDAPALGDTVITLAVDPADAGTLPATVTVPDGRLGATFTYTDLAVHATATVTATLGASTSSATITVSSGPNHLVINEVEYDEASADNAEFIELYNPTGVPISLAGIRVVLVNGANAGSIYGTVELDAVGELPPHTFLVLGRADLAVPPTAKKLTTTWPVSFIQNGEPDGVLLIDSVSHTVIDAISYEGSCPLVKPAGFPNPVSLVEGTPATATDENEGTMSICRFPDGTDTDNADADWKTCATGSPGTANPGPAPALHLRR
jgi:large repetitive protein